MKFNEAAKLLILTSVHQYFVLNIFQVFTFT